MWAAAAFAFCLGCFVGLAIMLGGGAALLDRRRQARARHRAALRYDADTQQAMTLDGDPRGTYGRFPPAV